MKNEISKKITIAIVDTEMILNGETDATKENLSATIEILNEAKRMILKLD